jgi:heme-degrading monooxygenase HmoA
MYARIVNMKLRKDGHTEFAKTFENEVIPMLRKQNGFRDEVSLLAPERLEVTGISFWNKKETADEYNRTTYPEVLKSLSKVIEGTPEVRSFEVSSSTFHKIVAGQPTV